MCIVGLMGVGKSTVARIVGTLLERPVVDSDPWIESRLGMSGREIALRDGVAALHRIEADMLIATLETPEPMVVTPAASVVADETCRARLRESALVAWLDLDPETAFERSRAGSHRRPTTLEDFRRMFAERRPAFEGIADITLDAHRTPRDLASEIVAASGQSSSSW